MKRLRPDDTRSANPTSIERALNVIGNTVDKPNN